MKTRLLVTLLVVVLLPISASAQTRARGLGINIPLLGRLVGGGNTLFLTAVDVANNDTAPTQVDFYVDGAGIATGVRTAIDGSIGSSGTLGALGTGGLMRGRSTARFDDFVEALIQANLLPASFRTDGFFGSVLFVFNGQARSGRGSAVARFYNRFADGFVGVSVKGREITSREPQHIVASISDTRSNSTGAPQMYPNMFINNTGLAVDGSGVAGPITVEVSAISNNTGQPIGVPITIADIGPGRVASVNQVLNALQIPTGTETTILVFARVTSGNAAIHGLISQVDAITRDGALFEMSRADF